MDMRLKGKTAVVTGAGRGIGLSTVRALNAEGVRVLGAARTITAELKNSADVCYSVDLTTPHGPSGLIDRAMIEFDGIDLLVNNAGGGDDVQLGGSSDLDDKHWYDTFALNLFAAVRVSRAASRPLIERAGAIVNVSSVGAWQPSGPPLAYNVAKAALKAFGKAMATEIGPYGVRVNTVSPGPVRTDAWEAPNSFGGKLAAASGMDQHAYLAEVPAMMGMATGRIIEPEEVAALIVYLLSDVAASITGSDYLIDGGIVRRA
ncbi:SDR family oxidoreductase [Mycolicibacterium poriferae]|uniref:SDR family oxidoreductase n=1 Tax=Mycolicibacterium poriferae TaxID=39694 RepID=UPI0024BAE323|nr:SDR family oxidoreductase [Mycolicibacterium poriferae]